MADRSEFDRRRITLMVLYTQLSCSILGVVKFGIDLYLGTGKSSDVETYYVCVSLIFVIMGSIPCTAGLYGVYGKNPTFLIFYVYLAYIFIFILNIFVVTSMTYLYYSNADSDNLLILNVVLLLCLAVFNNVCFRPILTEVIKYAEQLKEEVISVDREQLMPEDE